MTAPFAERVAQLLADPTFEPELLAESQRWHGNPVVVWTAANRRCLRASTENVGFRL